MGIREKINEKRSVSIGVTVALLCVCAVAIGYQITQMGPQRPGMPKSFYTTDEGKTLFTERADRLPPFEHEGRQAVRAYVYRCGGKQFVAYLERHTPEAHKLLTELDYAAKNAKPGDPPPKNLAAAPGAQRNGREVKKPGGKEWVGASTPAGAKLVQVVSCPDGDKNTPELVNP